MQRNSKNFITRHTLFLSLLCLIALCPEVQAGKVETCNFKGKRLYGKVKIVENFPDITVQVVNNFPDLKVKWVEYSPDACGEWMAEEGFPELKVKFVENFPDLKIKFVENFPGIP